MNNHIIIHNTMTKAPYTRPQSEEVRLAAPIVLQSGSGFNEKGGTWDDELIFAPGSIEDLL